ncbi:MULTISPECIES: contractile injection system protein, VgrG/Pvc8 family [unclassified Sphingomonas]|uniref:contractile injection system protein, VgrG/Pvc8 family n=1 Tax=unclassified Sphingomonas TaxID=196159 RepID=UPI002269E10D
MTVANIHDFRLTLAGQDLRGTLYDEAAALTDITAKVRPRLVSLTLSEKRGGEADQLDLVLDDTDGLLALPAIGAVLKLQLGWKQGSDVSTGLVDKGSFTVDEVQHAGPPDQVTIRARSADFTGALKVRREQSWHATTLGAIVNEIAGRQKLTPRCAATLAGIAIDGQHQSRESDMALLRRLGREHDAVATIKGGALILAPIGTGTTASGKPLPALALSRRAGDTHTYRVAKREAAEGISAGWHDRKGARRQFVTVGKADGAKKLSRTYANEADARAAAQAAKGRAEREPVSLDWTLALGRADIYPEQKASVSGFKAAIDAVAWVLTEVTHRLDQGGFKTAVKLEST